ncbi:MAG TPA: sigma-70 family RNA polymerase sigma factor [Gemmatimonadota bacterium]|nr:sigma-70 family RNA polymerase sigma factor [Gemmatimonadota bacterium]
MKPDATSLLVDWRRGSRDALDSLFPLVYEELRRVAHRALRGQPSGLTLSTTALVHESYLKLIVNERVSWQDRAHFLALASRAMRFVLVSYARAHGAKKRGGGRTPLELDEDLSVSDERADEMLALDTALEKLSALNERLGRIVELRFFGGLTVEEISEALEISPSTVKLDWQKARAWLYREITET